MALSFKVFFCLAMLAVSPTSTMAQADWPPATREMRPWAYWWWMGSAVDEANLSRELQRYRAAGYGGVHIIPIYGAKGWESHYIEYLSPRWMEMLDYTVREAGRLGMGVDMTTGTGWCFGGGPHVGANEGNATVVVKTFDVAAGQGLTERLDRAKTQALMAFPPAGNAAKPMDLLSLIKADGSVDWQASEGQWKVYAVSQKLHPQKVKRAAPGGEGPMLNLIYPDAMPVFLRQYTEAFSKYRGLKPRAQYHDSYEYKSEWAPDFFEQFEKRRGYKLQNELPALFSQSNDHAARVLTDYRETVSDVMIEDSLPQWVDWSHRRGFITRNEAHGSPGNLLDLYALADVPETEMFRLDRNKLISKFASSAAHVAGHNLVGCETGTWLKEHFTETLADMKYLLDDLFVSGVNHVFYHGTCYSPDEAGWPGWVFYASYEMNPRNAIWRDARTLNQYVTRCQSVLQSGAPDNEVLLYWPIHDFWQKAAAEPLLPHLTVHAREWFEAQPIGHIAEALWNRGYGFDYISDRQLAGATVRDAAIHVPGGSYRVVVVPPCEFLPLATLEKLVQMADAGARVIFAGELPKDVPGWGGLEERRKRFKELLQQIQSGAKVKDHVLVGDPEAALNRSGVSRETLVDQTGLFYIRRAIHNGRYYFIANRGDQPVEGWVPLAAKATTGIAMDPMTGDTGVARLRQPAEADNPVSVYLQLEPGDSIILKLTGGRAVSGPAWNYWDDAGPKASTLTGSWQVKFLQGGPTLPATYTTSALGSWTARGGDAENFAGTARYTLNFDFTGAIGPTRLSLGNVAQSARVKLNGKSYGTLLTAPFAVVVDNLQPQGNQLEVEVTSTSANAIRYYDQNKVPWKNFRDINFVNQNYRPFDASGWPVTDCGLLGPVSLSPVQPLKLAEAGK